MESLGGIRRLVPPGSTVLLKPNLVVEKPNSSGATTSPVVVDAVLEQLARVPLREIIIGESAAVSHSTMEAYRVSGIAEVARKRGVRLVDFKKDRQVELSVPRGRSIAAVQVAETVLKADFLINLPILKVHSQTRVTAGLKNLKGCISDAEKKRFHRLDLEQCIADLNTVIKSDLVIVDATLCSLAWEEGGDPVRLDTVIAGTNVLAVDSFAATLLGYNPEEIRHFLLAEEHGLGSTRREAIELENLSPLEKVRAKREPVPKGRFSRKIPGLKLVEDGACTPCLGALYTALQRLAKEGKKVKLTVALGQKVAASHAGEAGPDWWGIGKCGCRLTGEERGVQGCPPGALEIYRALKEISGRQP